MMFLSVTAAAIRGPHYGPCKKPARTGRAGKKNGLLSRLFCCCGYLMGSPIFFFLSSSSRSAGRLGANRLRRRRSDRPTPPHCLLPPRTTIASPPLRPRRRHLAPNALIRRPVPRRPRPRAPAVRRNATEPLACVCSTRTRTRASSFPRHSWRAKPGGEAADPCPSRSGTCCASSSRSST